MPFIFKLVRRLSASRLLATLAMGATVACGQEALTDNSVTDVEIVDIDVTPKAASLEPEQQQKFSARGVTAVGTSVATTVVWEATGGSIDQQGMFTATAPGEFEVVATHSVRTWLSDSASAMVSATEQSLQLWPNDVTIPVNSTLEFRAFRLAGGGDTTNVDVTWETDGGFIERTGAGRGLYTADEQAGNHTITVTAEGGETASAEVEVTDVRVASIAISPSGASVLRGATRQLQAVARDEDGNVLSNRHVAWTSNNASVAAITSDGLVVGVSVGSVQITATSEGESDQATVSVSETPVASVSVTPSTANLVSGQTQQLNATPRDANGNALAGRAVTWTTSNGSVATVNAAGLVTAVGSGSTTVRATSEGQSGTASVTVTTAPVASVTVSPQTLTVFVGRTGQLRATVRDGDGNELTGRSISWSSSNQQVATVTQNGVVTSVAVGTATITATSEGQSGTATFTASNVAVGSVQVAPTSVDLEEGETAQLSATVRATTGEVLTGRVVTWSSSNSQVAQVSSGGLVTAEGPGTATITATSEGQSATSAITVTLVPVASVQVTPSNVSLTVGQGRNLSATPRDADGNALSGRSVSWSSSNASVATVNQQGRVTAVANGTATITATSEGVEGTSSVTVSQVPVASVSVSPSSATLEPGETEALTATPRDAGGNPLSGRAVAWSSSNASVATVNQQGTVTAVALGTATITATSEGESGTATITVAQPVASVDVSPSSASLAVGETQNLTATPRDGNGNALTGRSVSWSSNETDVATVNQQGVVTAVAAGSATITATSEGESGTASITVTAAPVASVTVSPSSASLGVAQQQTFSATMRDDDGNVLTGRSVSWTSSNALVASVNQNGRVTGLLAGNTTIRATSEGVQGTATVTVELVPVATVNVSPASVSLSPGQTRSLVATLLDAIGNILTGRTVTWSSTNSSVASVNQQGVITAQSEGTATVVATAEGVSDSAQITVQQGGGIQPITAEDFSGYTSTSHLLSDPRNIYAGSEDKHSGVVLDMSQGYGTSDRSMRYDWPASGCVDQTRNRKVLEFPSNDEVWIEIVAKFAPNFDTFTSSSCSEAAAYKFLFFTSGSSAYLNRFQLVNGIFGNRWDAGHATNQNAYLGEGSMGQNPLWDGQWHTYRFHFKLGRTDGVFRYSIDGVMQIDEVNISTDNNGGLNTFNWLVLGANINQGPLNATSLWWGAIKIWSGDPGWNW